MHLWCTENRKKQDLEERISLKSTTAGCFFWSSMHESNYFFWNTGCCYLVLTREVALSPSTIRDLFWEKKFACHTYVERSLICLPWSNETQNTKPGGICETHGPGTIPASQSAKQILWLILTFCGHQTWHHMWSWSNERGFAERNSRRNSKGRYNKTWLVSA